LAIISLMTVCAGFAAAAGAAVKGEVGIEGDEMIEGAKGDARVRTTGAR
jgi:hypothetical protein